jgi:hypothetical protein
MILHFKRFFVFLFVSVAQKLTKNWAEKSPMSTRFGRRFGLVKPLFSFAILTHFQVEFVNSETTSSFQKDDAHILLFMIFSEKRIFWPPGGSKTEKERSNKKTKNLLKCRIRFYVRKHVRFLEKCKFGHFEKFERELVRTITTHHDPHFFWLGQ